MEMSNWLVGPMTMKAEWSTVLGGAGHKCVEMEDGHSHECREVLYAMTYQAVSHHTVIQTVQYLYHSPTNFLKLWNINFVFWVAYSSIH